MFVLCLKVKEFWNLVLEYIKCKDKTTLLFTPFNILLGYTLAEVNQQPINTILLVAKNIYLSLQINVKILISMDSFIDYISIFRTKVIKPVM